MLVNTNSFPGKLARLKESLGVDEDQEAAAALGMTKAALSARKQRDAFPDERVLQLVAARPDLGLDAVYILTGDRALIGAARDHLQSTAKVVGSVMSGNADSDELLARIAVELAERKVALRKRRRAEYEELLMTLDCMSDATLRLLQEVAARLARDDVSQAQSRTRDQTQAPASDSRGDAGEDRRPPPTSTPDS